ncbi:MAG: ABC transporter permease [Nocardiopsaceae bacterium]|jgi:ABC-type lipoprotein release transport system permease subunit|nr:ABC transporter permease [Nocardiopsaceae bacterium]
MFFDYLFRELSRRPRQALLAAFGFAIGIGLVIVVTGVSAGLAQAQSQVLHALYGVGTDATVTKAASSGSGSGPVGIKPGLGAGGSGSGNQDFFHTLPGQDTLAASDETSIDHLKDVAGAAGALQLIEIEAGQAAGTTSSGHPGSGGQQINVNTTLLDGIDVGHPHLGPITSSDLTKGRYFTSFDANADVALLDASYAQQHGLKVGSTITLSGTAYTVVGLVNAPSGSASIYVPLARAQALAALPGMVSTIYVKASSASAVSTMASQIKHRLPGTTVTTASDLAQEITGSLSSAANLVSELGTWLSLVVLVVAFGVAALLSMAAVSRRVRELGTLKALGWSAWRMTAQIMGETLTQGLVGGALGIGLGVGGALLIDHFAPSLNAGLSPLGGSGPNTGSGPGRGIGALGGATTVHLTAPIELQTLLLAVALAVAGGLIAGTLSGWRAARLRPAAALRRVE